MGIKSWFGNKKSVQMCGTVNRVERDMEGNFWYLSDFFGSRSGCKSYYDMTNNIDKAHALVACTPLYTVADKIGSMISRGTVFVTDKNGNEKRSFNDIRNIINNPNPLQTFSSFIKTIEINIKIFGYCPIVFVRGTKSAVPNAMWIVPPELFHMESTGKVFSTFEFNEVIKRAYINWNGRQMELAEWEYSVIYDSQLIIKGSGMDVCFESVSDSLSQPVSNWIASMSASHTLMVHGGPKGIVYRDYEDEMGNISITPDEEEDIKEKFKDDYGLVNKKYPVLVSRHKLGWLPLDFNSSQLKLHEEDKRCTEKICNALGVNPNLFSDAKYDNQESAKKSAYQDLIIPDSKKIADILTREICPDGVFIKIDFSDVECLQANKESEANTLVKMADAMYRLLNNGLITHEEARIELARYIGIDPNNPKGEFETPDDPEQNIIEDGTEE